MDLLAQVALKIQGRSRTTGALHLNRSGVIRIARAAKGTSQIDRYPLRQFEDGAGSSSDDPGIDIDRPGASQGLSEVTQGQCAVAAKGEDRSSARAYGLPRGKSRIQVEGQVLTVAIRDASVKGQSIAVVGDADISCAIQRQTADGDRLSQSGNCRGTAKGGDIRRRVGEGGGGCGPIRRTVPSRPIASTRPGCGPRLRLQG